MPVRNFTWSNLPNLLDFIGAVQAQTAHDRPLRQKSFQEALQEPGLDPESNCFLLLQDQEILGCCLVFPETPIRRAVLALDAAPNIEGSGQEAELVRRAIRRSQELNAEVAHICLAPGSPRKALLEQENFHLGRVYLDLVWQGDQLPPSSTSQPSNRPFLPTRRRPGLDPNPKRRLHRKLGVLPQHRGAN